MSEQVQHTLRTKIGMEDLKDLLIKDEKHRVILNPEHQVWLCINENSAKDLAHSKGVSDILEAEEDPEGHAQELANTIFILQASIVVKLVGGSTNNNKFKNVSAEYYLYRKRISKDKAEREYGTEFITIVEEFKETYETYFKQIKKEEYARKYAKLAEILGEEKANYLLNTNYSPEAKLLHLVSIDGFFSNQYGDMAGNTTHEERAQLLELGIEVRI